MKWLWMMGYHPDRVVSVESEILNKCKTDIRLKITTKDHTSPKNENIQVKLVSGKSGFNQVDKRWVSSYENRWNIPENIAELLRHYTGEKKPFVENTKDKRKMNLNEFPQKEKEMILHWFKENKHLILMDIFKGRGEESVDWFLIIQNRGNQQKEVLLHISEILKMLEGSVSVTVKGVLSIGPNLTMQRKGGDGGRKTANMLQFKCNPLYFF